MDFWQGFIIVTFAHLLAAASPGPDFALVTRQALVRGRSAGILTSLGIALGLSVHILYSVAGLAAVVAHSSRLMFFVKLAGAAYLVYLGVKGLRARPGRETTVDEPEGHAADGTPLRLIATGFLCNAFNPKAPVYFLALFTVVLSPDLPLRSLAAYGAWIMALQMLWFSAVACFFASPPVRLRMQRVGHWIDRAFGAAMLALGIRILGTDL